MDVDKKENISQDSLFNQNMVSQTRIIESPQNLLLGNASMFPSRNLISSQNNKAKFFQIQYQNQMLNNEYQRNLNNQGSSSIKQSQDFKNNNRSTFQKKNEFRSVVQTKKTIKQTNQLEKQKTSKKKHNKVGINTSGVDKMNQTKKKKGLNFSWFYIKKFITKIKQCSSRLRFKQLTRPLVELINDVSTDYNYFYYRKYFVNDQPSFWSIQQQKMSSCFFIKIFNIYIIQGLKLNKIETVVMPNSWFSTIWSFIIFILLVLNIFFVPLKISFDISESQSDFNEILLDIIPNYAFIVEIILKFNTAFYQHGHIITDRSVIFSHYLNGRFIWDSLIVTTYILGRYVNTLGWLELALILRLFDVMHMYEEIEERFRLRERIEGLSEMIKLSAIIIYMSHFLACAFYFVARLEIESGVEKTWMGDSAYVYKERWSIYYWDSFYFAVVTMSTIGYGDITPETEKEKQFVTVATLLSSFLFAYSMSSIQDILRNKSRRQKEFNQKITVLNSYMNKRDLNPHLKIKVRKYFQYMFSQETEYNEEGNNFINNLNQNLRREVYKDIYGRILGNCKLFYHNYSQDCISELALYMKEKRCANEEIIFHVNDYSDKIYFILKGKVQKVHFKKNILDLSTTPVVVQTINELEYFGETGFYTGDRRHSTHRSSGLTIVSYLEKKDFLKVIKKFPNDQEAYFQQKDKANIYSDISGMGTQCEGCGKFTHTITECQLVKVIPDPQKVISHHCISIDQKRFPKIRYQRIKQSAWKNQFNINEIVNAIQEYFQSEDDEYDEDDEDEFYDSSSSCSSYSGINSSMNDQNNSRNQGSNLNSSRNNVKDQSKSSKQTDKNVDKNDDNLSEEAFFVKNKIERQNSPLILNIEIPKSKNQSNNNEVQDNSQQTQKKVNKVFIQSPCKKSQTSIKDQSLSSLSKLTEYDEDGFQNSIDLKNKNENKNNKNQENNENDNSIIIQKRDSQSYENKNRSPSQPNYQQKQGKSILKKNTLTNISFSQLPPTQQQQIQTNGYNINININNQSKQMQNEQQTSKKQKKLFTEKYFFNEQNNQNSQQYPKKQKQSPLISGGSNKTSPQFQYKNKKSSNQSVFAQHSKQYSIDEQSSKKRTPKTRLRNLSENQNKNFQNQLHQLALPVPLQDQNLGISSVNTLNPEKVNQMQKSHFQNMNRSSLNIMDKSSRTSLKMDRSRVRKSTALLDVSQKTLNNRLPKRSMMNLLPYEKKSLNSLAGNELKPKNTSQNRLSLNTPREIDEQENSIKQSFQVNRVSIYQNSVQNIYQKKQKTQQQSDQFSQEWFSQLQNATMLSQRRQDSNNGSPQSQSSKNQNLKNYDFQLSNDRYVNDEVIQINMDFDVMKKYVIYFPHNNYQNVIKGYQIYRKGLGGYTFLVQLKSKQKKMKASMIMKKTKLKNKTLKMFQKNNIEQERKNENFVKNVFLSNQNETQNKNQMQIKKQNKSQVAEKFIQDEINEKN